MDTQRERGTVKCRRYTISREMGLNKTTGRKGTGQKKEGLNRKAGSTGKEVL